MCDCAKSVRCCDPPPRGGLKACGGRTATTQRLLPCGSHEQVQRTTDGQPCYLLPYRTDPCNEGKSRVVHRSDGPAGRMTRVTVIAVFRRSGQVITL